MPCSAHNQETSGLWGTYPQSLLVSEACHEYHATSDVDVRRYIDADIQSSANLVSSASVAPDAAWPDGLLTSLEALQIDPPAGISSSVSWRGGIQSTAPLSSIPLYGGDVAQVPPQSQNMYVQAEDGLPFFPYEPFEEFARNECSTETGMSDLNSGIVTARAQIRINGPQPRLILDDEGWRAFLALGELDNLVGRWEELWRTIQDRMTGGFLPPMGDDNPSAASRAQDELNVHGAAPVVVHEECKFGPDCPEPFNGSALNDARRHIRAFHTGNGFVCMWNDQRGGIRCKRALKDADGLVAHITTVHLKANVRECPGCKKKYSRSDALARHRTRCDLSAKSQEEG